MDEYYTVIQGLPAEIKTELMRLPSAKARTVQEIRLRLHQPLQFTIGGRLVPAQLFLPQAAALRRLTPDILQKCFLALCGHSAYAYEKELACGYFTTDTGSRVGVAGLCSQEGFAVVRALNLRVARWVTCPLPSRVQQAVQRLEGGILVAGVPGSGKTTFLRSLIMELTRWDRIFCVVDERGELVPQSLTHEADAPDLNCDVYTRVDRAAGINMALRCMNPQAIVCDELGTAADASALEAGLASGVVFLASVHCDSPEHLYQKPQLASLLKTGAFSLAVFLSGRDKPGQVTRMVNLS